MKYTYVSKTIFFLLFAVIGVTQVYALAPNNQSQVLDTIEPIIHVGAGAQSIQGPLLLGSLQLIPQTVFRGLQAVSQNIDNPRPSIFKHTSGNSFFTALGRSLFAREVFVGFAENNFSKQDPYTSTSDINSPQRLNLSGTFLATNLNTAAGNTSGESRVCFNADGVLVLCPKQTFSWVAEAWEVCSNGFQSRAVGCRDDQNQHVDSSLCESSQDAGPKPDSSRVCDDGEDVPLDWNGNPYTQCEGGQVMAYVGVVGNKGQAVQFRREGGVWEDANIGDDQYKHIIPTYDNPNESTPDKFCKTFYYRVPGLGVNDQVWGCVDTQTSSQCS